MIVAHQSQERAYQKYAWVILLVLSILLVVNILIVAAVEDHAKEFMMDTRVAWDAFSAAYPGVATAYTLNQALLYIGFIGVALFTLAITYFGFRQGHRWAWFAAWLFPATMTLTGILMTQSSRPGIGAIYGGFAVLAVIGLLLPIRKFFPNQS